MTILMTGAHVTPAVALTQSLLDRIPGARIVYVGRNLDSIERSEIERVGGHFTAMASGKLHRFPTLSQLIEFGKLSVGVIRAIALVRKEKPDAIVSFGGYLSVPIVAAGSLFRIPVVIHEETAVWGLANRMCRPFASAVAVSWPHMEEPGVILTGNPMPKEIIQAGKKQTSTDGMKVLYITEGSQGSLAVSRLVRESLEKLLPNFEIYHQTKYPARVSSSRYHAARWFSTPDHAALLARTSLSVSRAGANTVTYHAYFGIPSILIPLPHAGGGEQMKNAQLFAETGLARIIPQPECSPKRLVSEITSVASWSAEAVDECRKRARALVRTDASERLADLVLAHSRAS